MSDQAVLTDPPVFLFSEEFFVKYMGTFEAVVGVKLGHDQIRNVALGCASQKRAISHR